MIIKCNIKSYVLILFQVMICEKKSQFLSSILKCDLLKSISVEYVTQKLLSKEKFGSTCATFAA